MGAPIVLVDISTISPLTSVQKITGIKHVLPTHQGRAAEAILAGTLIKKGNIIPNNSHFDTTRANIEHAKMEAVDLLIDEGRHAQGRHPFKGNMDVERLVELIERVGWKHYQCAVAGFSVAYLDQLTLRRCRQRSVFYRH